MPGVLHDFLFAIRIFRRDKWFAAVAVLTLALGIAVNATVFGWIHTVLLNPFPGAGNAGELALIESVTPSGEYLVNTSVLDYLDYRSNLKLVSGVALGRFTPLSMGPGGRTQRAWAELVSPNYFDVLQVKPILGRSFGPEERREQEGANPVAIISYRTWQSRFHGDPNVLGKDILLNRNRLTIIGVAPPGFRGSLAGVVFDVWAPITLATAMGTGNGTLHYRGTRDETSTIVRLKPGAGLEQARAEVAALGRRLAEMYPETNRGVDLTLTPLWQGHLGTQGVLRKPLGILMAVCSLLLLIACANVANLLLARAVSRQKELGIRLALGARPVQVTRQLLIETLILAAAGALAGVFLAMGMGRTLALMVTVQDVPLDLGGGIDTATLAFTVALTILTTLISGLAPAAMAAHCDLDEVLREGGRGGGSGRKSHRLRRLLVAVEMGLAIVALIGAGLLWRSFRNASAIQPGFDRTNVSVSQFYLSYAGYSGPEQWRFCRELRSRMEANPGVIGVTYSDVVPMSTVSGAGLTPWHKLEIPGYVPAANEQMMIHRATVPPGYFKLLGIRMLEGRDFTESDSVDAPMVIIVNETFARRFFHGAYPIGRKVRLEGNLTTVVGLAKDSKYHTPAEGPLPFFYIPFRQWFYPGLNFSIFVKTAGDPLRMTPALQREALALNQDATFTTRLLADANAGSLSDLNVGASLLSVVGALSLLMAAIGLYSVMSYAVSQRTQELGLRMALGAQPGQVLRQVLREAVVMMIPGVLAGVVIALAASGVLGGMLVGVSVTDPLTFAGAAAFLSLVAAAASYFPARRATKSDPMASLRSN
ncbi:MAG TPA: ABC transporter permease [Candidatus Acidoferrales bacterium]|nr:ABC transporter permease [Candidatus Acidoferrales bacterium]